MSEVARRRAFGGQAGQHRVHEPEERFGQIRHRQHPRHHRQRGQQAEESRYRRRRSKLTSSEPSAAAPIAGPPPEAAPAGGETTHLSVVDAEGNAVALTQTNSSTFGSGARVAGFFLNDSGIDFSRSPGGERTGRSEWHTRRTTIAPTIVLEDGRVAMVVGAPGAGRIPTAIVQNMVYVLDYGLDPLEAVRMPRIFPSTADPGVQLETGFDAEVLRQARRMGYRPAALSFGYARLYMIVRRGGRWIGVADPRHDGEVRGY